MLSRLASTSSKCPRCLLKHLPQPPSFCLRTSISTIASRDEDSSSSQKASIQRHWFSLYQNAAPSMSKSSFVPNEMLFGGATGLRALQNESNEIPTTVESSEMGGADDGMKQALSFFGSLSEGTDVGAALVNLAENADAESLASESVSVTEPVATTETKKRLVRYLPPMEYHESQTELPSMVEESAVPIDSIVHRFTPELNRSEPACVNVLRRAIENRDLDEIRAELSRFQWPSLKTFGPLIPKVFQLFASNLKSKDDVSEMLAVMADLADTHSRAIIADATTLHLLANVCAATNAECVVSTATEIRKIFSSHAEMPSPRRTNRSAPAAVALFEAAFAHETASMHSVARLADSLIDLHFLDNKDVFLEVAARLLVKQLKFKQLFTSWAAYAISDGTVAGAHVLFEAALTSKSVPKKLQERQILQILDVYGNVKSPGDGIAQLIVSLIATGSLMDAEILMSKLSVDCGNFIRPLRQWASDPKEATVNSIHIQQFASLVEACILGEVKRRNPKQKDDGFNDAEFDKLSPEEPERIEAMPLGNVAFVINAFRPNGRKLTFVTKKKYRRHKVKADQLDKLLNTIQNVWIRIAEHNGSASDVNNLRQFLSKNHFVMTPATQHRAEAIFNANGLPSPFESVVNDA